MHLAISDLLISLTLQNVSGTIYIYGIVLGNRISFRIKCTNILMKKGPEKFSLE